MKIFLIVALVVCSVQLHAADLDFASPESVGMSSQRLARIEPFMTRYVVEGKLAGIVTLIARQGKIVHFESVGTLNIETGEALEQDDLFRIYSMTKPVVSVAAMMLYEQGLFQLDEPVSRYVPAFKDTQVLVNGIEVEQDHDFTIRELMSHTAGLTYGVFGDTSVDRAYREAGILRGQDTLKDMVEALGEIPLLYQPGTRWVYSVSADVLGRLIEVIADQPLDQYLDEKLFTPLGMHDTFFQVPEDKLDRFGTNHQRDPESKKLTVVDRPQDSRYTREVTFFSGGGGLVSTAMDYLRFSQMLLNGGELNGTRVLSPKTVELMTINHLGEGVTAGFGERPREASSFAFGLGFGVAEEHPRTGVGSPGEYNWGGAAGTVFWNDPQEDLTAVLMVQMMNNPYPLRGQFKALTYQAIVD